MEVSSHQLLFFTMVSLYLLAYCLYLFFRPVVMVIVRSDVSLNQNSIILLVCYFFPIFSSILLQVFCIRLLLVYIIILNKNIVWFEFSTLVDTYIEMGRNISFVILLHLLSISCFSDRLRLLRPQHTNLYFTFSVSGIKFQKTFWCLETFGAIQALILAFLFFCFCPLVFC